MRVSNSQIQCYKSCRRMYQLKYIEGVYPTSTTQALERGISYHEKIEQLFKDKSFQLDSNIKANAMALAFEKYILPKLDAIAEEEWFNYYTKDGHKVVGRIDARNKDGKLIEHKTTSGDIDESYWYSLETDEQILTYMLAYKVNYILYTVCKTPTIRQKQNETDEEFQQRCIEWYDTDTEYKIAMRELYRSDEEIKEFEEIQRLTIKEMDECNLFYRNTGYCWHWGRMCEYAPICKHYDPSQEYIGFVKEGCNDGNETDSS